MIPGVAQLEPVDRLGADSGAEFSVERREVGLPPDAVIIVCKSSPILIPVVVQAGASANQRS